MKSVLERRHGAKWSHDPWDDSDTMYAVMLERPPRQSRWGTWIVYAALLGLTAGLLVVGVRGLDLAHQLNPVGEPGPPTQFEVRPADTIETLSARLEADGFVTDGAIFEDYVDDRGGLILTPGDYVLRPMANMSDILSSLRIPPAETFSNVTFPEGFTLEKMATRLGEKVPRMSAEDFELVVGDGTIRSVYQPTGVTSMEGMLFPDTYQVSNSMSEAQLVEQMVALMERVGRQENIEARSAELGITPYQVLIIASMIEREAKLDEDRAKIARVIYNRLYLGIPLGIDATLFYGQPPDTPFSVLKAADTPYNTYLRVGLPPTPIANPGRASIRAALNPAPNPAQGDPLCTSQPKGSLCLYLYYVLINEEGGHAFAANLEQHEANVAIARELGLLG